MAKEYIKLSADSLRLFGEALLDYYQGVTRATARIIREDGDITGLSVLAIDIAPKAVQVIRSRGVKDTACVDVMDYRGGKFDSILILGHGLGMAQDLAGLDRLLRKLHTLITRNGTILCDSIDVQATTRPEHLQYQKRLEIKGRYKGEIRFQIEYNGVKGDCVKWLHVDPMTLAQAASATGFRCEVLASEGSGDYLAGLYPL